MDLFTAISIIVLVLIVITPFLALAIGFTARKRINNLTALFDQRVEERNNTIAKLWKCSREDGDLIAKLTVSLDEANILIEKLTEASNTLLGDYEKKNQQLKDLESEYNLLVISIQGKDARITELNELLSQRDKKIEELLFQLDKLENQS